MVLSLLPSNPAHAVRSPVAIRVVALSAQTFRQLGGQGGETLLTLVAQYIEQVGAHSWGLVLVMNWYRTRNQVVMLLYCDNFSLVKH